MDADFWSIAAVRYGGVAVLVLATMVPLELAIRVSRNPRYLQAGAAGALVALYCCLALMPGHLSLPEPFLGPAKAAALVLGCFYCIRAGTKRRVAA